jgi:hypothetical protein
MNRVTFETETVPEEKQVDTKDNVTATVTPASSPAIKSSTPIPPASNNMKSKKTKSTKTVMLGIVVVILGILSGYLIYSSTNTNTSIASTTTSAIPKTAESVVEGEVYGAEVSDAFKDEAQGVLIKGGIKGEGTHHIIRDGGPSRNVYLTSSVLDLNLFNDHEVKVWGETFQAQEAGWLMDVGRVEVVKLNAEKPFEEDTEL